MAACVSSSTCQQGTLLSMFPHIVSRIPHFPSSGPQRGRTPPRLSPPETPIQHRPNPTKPQGRDRMPATTSMGGGGKKAEWSSAAVAVALASPSEGKGRSSRARPLGRILESPSSSMTPDRCFLLQIGAALLLLRNDKAAAI